MSPRTEPAPDEFRGCGVAFLLNSKSVRLDWILRGLHRSE